MGVVAGVLLRGERVELTADRVISSAIWIAERFAVPLNSRCSR